MVPSMGISRRNSNGCSPKRPSGVEEEKCSVFFLNSKCLKWFFRPPPKFKNVSERPFLPPIGFKKHATPGDYYGCFSGNIEAFSNKRKPRPPHKPELRNCITGPGKKGGPGYADIGLDKYPEHK